MAYPIVELITQNVDETLRGVRVSAGFNLDLIVEREIREGNRLRDKLAVLKQVETERVIQSETQQSHMAWRQRYWVELYVVQSEDCDTPFDRAINVIRADAEKAVMADHTRGGYAHDTFILDPIPIVDEEGRWNGIVVAFDVFFRHVFGNPYTQ